LRYIYLHGFLSGPSSKKGVFLFRKFQKAGIDLLRPDLNGDDFEHLTISSQLKIIDDLICSGEGDITMIGSSLGGFLATLSAERRPQVKKLVLMAPAFDFIKRYFDRLTTEQIADWEKTGFIRLYQYHYREHRKLGYDIVDDAKKYDAISFKRQFPVLIFHGIKDASVPYQVSIDFLTAHSSVHLVLLNSDHGLLDQIDNIWKYTSLFLEMRSA
jgi:pimeloyl-ACP methyl ester carboxylesterase